MGEAKKRKVPSPEFKAKVGLEALRGVKTINELGQEYGVHPVQVGQWKKEIQAQASTLFEGKRGPKPVAAHREPELLYSEIGKLKMELDWLKKSPLSPRAFNLASTLRTMSNLLIAARFVRTVCSTSVKSSCATPAPRRNKTTFCLLLQRSGIVSTSRLNTSGG